MSDDPLTRRLSQFKPDAGVLDRDTLLFAAGRASVRPNRVWPALAGVLAVSQMVILGFFLWPRPTETVPDPIKHTAPTVAVEPTPPVIVEPSWPDPTPSLWALREQIIASDGKLPMPEPIDLAPSNAAPQRVGPLSAQLLN
jgi:hypothetical protein